MSNIKLTDFCDQIIIFFSAIMMSITGIVGIDLTKYCLYIIVAVALVKIVFIKMELKQLLALVLITTSSIVTLMTYTGIFSSFLVFLSSLIFALSVYNDGISSETWKLLKGCTYIVFLAYFVSIFIGTSTNKQGQFVLFFDNPNMTGIAICGITIIFVLMVAENKGKKFNFINWIILLACLYMIFITENRGSLITAVAIVVVMLFATYSKSQKRIRSKALLAFLKLLPIVVMFLYIGIYALLPNDIKFLGKPLFSGREGAWMIAIEKIFYNPFAHFFFEDGTLNLFLEGTARYGLLAMIGYFWFLFTLKAKDTTELDSVQYIAYIAFHICLFQQSFESTLVSGSYSVFVWTYILLGVASMKTKTEEKSRFNTTQKGLGRI